MGYVGTALPWRGGTFSDVDLKPAAGFKRPWLRDTNEA